MKNEYLRMAEFVLAASETKVEENLHVIMRIKLGELCADCGFTILGRTQCICHEKD